MQSLLDELMVVDYADMQSRDPDDRVPGVTVGVGRAILSNRLSHFLNIKVRVRANSNDVHSNPCVGTVDDNRYW